MGIKLVSLVSILAMGLEQEEPKLNICVRKLSQHGSHSMAPLENISTDLKVSTVCQDAVLRFL